MARDIILDTDDDLKITAGDFVIDEADAQNLADLIEIVPGELKTKPLSGIGAIRMNKKRQGPELLVAETRNQLAADNWVEPEVTYTETELNVKAHRKE